eukprot:7031778-Prymnesium_polylepis.3
MRAHAPRERDRDRHRETAHIALSHILRARGQSAESKTESLLPEVGLSHMVQQPLSTLFDAVACGAWPCDDGWSWRPERCRSAAAGDTGPA